MKAAAAERRARPTDLACLGCGYKFKTLGEAERVIFIDSASCPLCGGSDIGVPNEPEPARD